MPELARHKWYIAISIIARQNKMQNHLLYTDFSSSPALKNVFLPFTMLLHVQLLQQSNRREVDLVDVGGKVGRRVSTPAPHDFHFALEVARRAIQINVTTFNFSFSSYLRAPSTLRRFNFPPGPSFVASVHPGETDAPRAL